MDQNNAYDWVVDPHIVKIRVERCRADARLPRYAHPGDAGMDIFAAEEALIPPGHTVLIPTGLKFAIPPGYELQIRPRSGISLKTALRIPNSPGTIDSGYRDELGIIYANTCLPPGISGIDALRELDKDYSSLPVCDLDNPFVGVPCVYRIRKGDRIAQMLLAAVPAMEFVEVESVLGYGADRHGGFGSSGTGDDGIASGKDNNDSE